MTMRLQFAPNDAAKDILTNIDFKGRKRDLEGWISDFPPVHNYLVFVFHH